MYFFISLKQNNEFLTLKVFLSAVVRVRIRALLTGKGADAEAASAAASVSAIVRRRAASKRRPTRAKILSSCSGCATKTRQRQCTM